MKRFLPIITIILLLTFSLIGTKTFAIDPSPSIVSTSEKDSSSWDKFVTWFLGLFGQYYAKDYDLDLNRNKVIIEYSEEKNIPGDVSTRALPESSRDEMKMDYLRGVLETPPKFNPKVYLATCDDKVTVEDLANYKINKIPPTKGSIECYDKIYIESYSIPQGSKEETAQSENLNKAVRTLIPADSQGPTPILGTKDYSQDTAKQTKLFHQNMIPRDSQSSDDKELTKSFSQWLRPQNEQ